VDRRRFLLTSLAGALTGPLAAGGQGTRTIPRVGIVGATSPDVGRTSMDALRLGLRELGYIEGQSIVVEERARACEATHDLVPDRIGHSHKDDGRRRNRLLRRVRPARGAIDDHINIGP
jgi:hypothetical protein